MIGLRCFQDEGAACLLASELPADAVWDGSCSLLADPRDKSKVEKSKVDAPNARGQQSSPNAGIVIGGRTIVTPIVYNLRLDIAQQTEHTNRQQSHAGIPLRELKKILLLN
jgi:hypothetical protein